MANTAEPQRKSEQVRFFSVISRGLPALAVFGLGCFNPEMQEKLCSEASYSCPPGHSCEADNICRPDDAFKPDGAQSFGVALNVTDVVALPDPAAFVLVGRGSGSALHQVQVDDGAWSHVEPGNLPPEAVAPGQFFSNSTMVLPTGDLAVVIEGTDATLGVGVYLTTLAVGSPAPVTNPRRLDGVPVEPEYFNSNSVRAAISGNELSVVWLEGTDVSRILYRARYDLTGTSLGDVEGPLSTAAVARSARIVSVSGGFAIAWSEGGNTRLQYFVVDPMSCRQRDITIPVPILDMDMHAAGTRLVILSGSTREGDTESVVAVAHNCDIQGATLTLYPGPLSEAPLAVRAASHNVDGDIELGLLWRRTRQNGIRELYFSRTELPPLLPFEADPGAPTRVTSAEGHDVFADEHRLTWSDGLGYLVTWQDGRSGNPQSTYRLMGTNAEDPL